MFSTKQDQKLFNLSPHEAKILIELDKKEHMNVVEIAKKSKIPRTTVHFLLNKLLKREFVQKIPVANHYEWKNIPENEFSNRLRKYVGRFEGNSNFLGGIKNDSIDVEVHSGIEKIKEAYKKMLDVGRSGHIYAIQGNKSVGHLGKIEEKYFTHFHNELRRKNIIMDSILGESTMDDVFEKMSLSELNSHLDRTTIQHFVPDHFMDFEIDIMMFGNQIIFVNLKEEKVLLLKDRAIIKALKSLFLMAEVTGRKVDLNQHIRHLIEKKELEESSIYEE